MNKALKLKRFNSRRGSYRMHIAPRRYRPMLRRRFGIGTYTGTPDSDIIARYFDEFQPNSENREEVTKRFAHLVQP